MKRWRAEGVCLANNVIKRRKRVGVKWALCVTLEKVVWPAEQKNARKYLASIFYANKLPAVADDVGRAGLRENISCAPIFLARW